MFDSPGLEERMPAALEDVRIPVRLKLSALWCSVMFCYIYGDYFELYQPGKLQQMLAGRTALGAVTQASLLGMSVLLVVPAVMICLSLVLPARVGRWVNVGLGAAYSVIMVLAIVGAWRYYIFLGVVEIVLTLAISVYAWRWPRTEGAGAPVVSHGGDTSLRSD